MKWINAKETETSWNVSATFDARVCEAEDIT
jgi:hypothetical protein